MNTVNKHCVLIFDEMAIKSELLYNGQGDSKTSIEFEHFSSQGGTKCVDSYTLAFMVRGLARNGIRPMGILSVQAQWQAALISLI